MRGQPAAGAAVSGARPPRAGHVVGRVRPRGIVAGGIEPVAVLGEPIGGHPGDLGAYGEALSLPEVLPVVFLLAAGYEPPCMSNGMMP